MTTTMHSTLSQVAALTRLGLALIVVTSAMVAPVVTTGWATAATTQPLFEQVGTLERFPADARAVLGETLVPEPGNESAQQRSTSGTLIMVPKARLLLQLFPHPTGGPATGVAVRNIETLRITNTLLLPATIDRPTANFAGDWSHAVDDDGTRLWLYVFNQFVFEVDLRTFEVIQRPVPDPVFVPGFALGGMSYDRFTDDLILLYSGVGAANVANFVVLLYRMDVSKPPPASFSAEEAAKLYWVRSCSAPVNSTDVGSDTSNWDVLVDDKYLYVPCQRAGHTVIVVRMVRPDGPRSGGQQEDITAGPVWGDAVLADQEAGRLVVTTYNRQVWIFETSTMSFVGVVATGLDDKDYHEPTGYGLDPLTGRIFFQSPRYGLGVVEGRFFPIPQARTVPRLVEGRERIWSDAATSRIFVLEGTETTETTTAAAYRVYRVVPAPVPPSAPDADRNTTDVDERDGLTEARWNAAGSGYGSRALLAKGIGGVPPAPVVAGTAPTTGISAGLNHPDRLPCTFTDRDVLAGRVVKAEYDTGSTAAQAVALAVDGNTQQDLNQPERCLLLGLLLPPDAHRWDYRPATCASNEGMDKAPDPTTGDDQGSVVSSFGPSRVSCPLPGKTLEAEAETKLTSSGIEVQRSWTKTVIGRTEAGVVSTVESVAQGVSIELAGVGTLRIGEIRSKAVSSSNGRPKRGAMSTHEISIGDVILGGQTLCEHGCRDPLQLERELNLLTGGRAVFRTGHGDNSGRDDALVEGTARGAQTAVQKSVARQASDRALIGDFTVEVPALEVTVFNDNKDWGRARQLYQFAGVTSSATYNVVVRPSGSHADDISGRPDSGGATPDVGDSVFEGLAEAIGLTDQPEVLPDTAPIASAEDGTTGGAKGLRAALDRIARGLRVFLTSPRTALLLLSAWALLAAPAVLSRRRRLLAGVRSG